MKLNVIVVAAAICCTTVNAQARAQTCYVEGEETCDGLTEEFTSPRCQEAQCEETIGPILGLHLPWRCPQQIETEVEGLLTIAVHDDFGFDSFTTGGTVMCKRERDCKPTCGYPAPDEDLYCQSEGAWTESFPFAHTTPSGNDCYPAGYGDEF